MPSRVGYTDYRVTPPDERWRVYISVVPEEGGVWARLLSFGPRAAVAKALRRTMNLDAFEARWLLSEMPRDVDTFETEEEAQIVAQALREAGATCEVRKPRKDETS